MSCGERGNAAEMGHTPEPWSYEVWPSGCDIFDAEDHSIVDGSCGLIEEANARRIVACVNACAGIPTEELEKRPDEAGAWFARLDVAEKQRDELLAALIACETLFAPVANDATAANAIDVARIAIARAKGQPA